eukprot:Opistho-2@76459
MEAKIKEANGLVAEAEKLCQKTMFRWTADWDAAAPLLDKAANLYKAAKSFEKAKETFRKASTAHYKAKAIFHAAKSLENAALLAKEMKQPTEAAGYYEEAVSMYREDGKTDTAGLAYEKAAKAMVECQREEKAIEFFLGAAEVWEIDGKDRQCTENYKRAVSLLVKKKSYEKAIGVLRQQIRGLIKVNQLHNVYHNYLSIVVILLATDDFIAAERAYDEFLRETPQFASSDQSRSCDAMLTAFNAHDDEAFRAVTAAQHFTYLDNEITKMARTMKGGSTSYKPASQPTVVKRAEPLQKASSAATGAGQSSPSPTAPAQAKSASPYVGGHAPEVAHDRHNESDDEHSVNTPAEPSTPLYEDEPSVL